MSSAGSRSSRGDEFQLRIGVHYLLRLLDGELHGLQLESNGLPGQTNAIVVDDIVAIFADDRREYVQAKKNQPDHQSWSLRDRVLQEELKKSRDQLEADSLGTVRFFSRSPFGELKKLQEEAVLYPDYQAFQRHAGRVVRETFRALALLLERTDDRTFALLQRLAFGATREYDEWDLENERRLEQLLPSCAGAHLVLERFLASHESRLRNSKSLIVRPDVLTELARHGFTPTPLYVEKDSLSRFETASRIGRKWPREIAGVKLYRPEIDTVVSHIENGTRAVLVAAGPGSGKTCLLLDLADKFEAEGVRAVLFIKGDRFATIKDQTQLQENGLPDDIVGRCARLAAHRPVVVLLDSLDFLSINRSHGSLRVFLGLLEGLEKVDNVSTVVACRDFDLKYDPQLRDREWQKRVTLAGLNFESTVAPLLVKWGVEPTSLSSEMRLILATPQNLRLYHHLVKNRSDKSSVVSPFQLYSNFIDESISRQPELGHEALRKLEAVAANGLQQRRQTFPREMFDVSNDVLQQLISAEILVEGDGDAVGFSHQTIAESLAIRHALRAQRTLAEFVRAQSALPFVRPTVRAFFFHLRAQDKKAFRQQIWEVVNDPNIAYHLKRLVVESLAETQPDGADWPLLRRLFAEDALLFRRMLAQVRNDAWFDVLKEHWLPLIAHSPEATEWQFQYIATLERWLSTRPDEVIELWTKALSENWAPENSTWRMSIALAALSNKNAPGLRRLFELIIEQGTHRDMLHGPLSAWIASTESGDDLLWRLMMRVDTKSQDGTDHREPRDEFHRFSQLDQGFLIARLQQSDELLTLVTERLEISAAQHPERPGYMHEHLNETSWEQRHSRHDGSPADGLTVVIGSVERALKKRARDNDTWWRKNEPQLRESKDLGMRYIAIEAYRENASQNVAGVEAQLIDRELFASGSLDHELGLLMACAYHYVSEDVQDRNQSLILSLHGEFRPERGPLESWRARPIYDYAMCIPRPFRSAAVVEFLDHWSNEFGVFRPTPRIYMQGGLVSSPISNGQMTSLETNDLLRILRHYLGVGVSDTEWLGEGGLTGGLWQLRQVASESAALEPDRFLTIAEEFFDERLFEVFGPPILEGIASRLRYAVGTLSPSEAWNKPLALPSMEHFCSALIRHTEALVSGRQSISDHLHYTVSRSLQAVAESTESQENAERLTLVLWRLVKSEDPEPTTDDTTDLHMQSLNSTRGVAARAAMSLYCRWLELAKPLPKLLPYLIRRFASDAALGVRVSILDRLPFLTHHHQEFGWNLLADAFREPQTKLWLDAERLLYFQYRNAFDKVWPLLERIARESPEVAGETYGRLVALCYLAGHPVSHREALLTLATTEPIRVGYAQVFSANLHDRSTGEACKRMIAEMLRDPACCAAASAALSRQMGNQKTDGALSVELVLSCVEGLEASNQTRNAWGLFKWLERNAPRNPIAALEICERLIASRGENHYAHSSRELVVSLLAILREADETDDPNLIARAVTLQDEFLKHGVMGVEELLESSTFS